MAKFMKKLAASTAAAPSKTEVEFVPAAFALHKVEIIGGKKFEVGLQAECVKAGINRYGKPYCMLMVNGSEEFADPKTLKVLGPLAANRSALVKAEMEAAREAVLIVGGLVKNETEKAVLISHHGWFKAKWFPKAFVANLGDHEDGQQSLFELPTWKIRADMGPDAITALENLQSGYQKMLEPAAPEPKAPAKQTIIRRKVK